MQNDDTKGITNWNTVLAVSSLPAFLQQKKRIIARRMHLLNLVARAEEQSQDKLARAPWVP